MQTYFAVNCYRFQYRSAARTRFGLDYGLGCLGDSQRRPWFRKTVGLVHPFFVHFGGVFLYLSVQLSIRDPFWCRNGRELANKPKVEKNILENRLFFVKLKNETWFSKV